MARCDLHRRLPEQLLIGQAGKWGAEVALLLRAIAVALRREQAAALHSRPVRQRMIGRRQYGGATTSANR